VSQKRRVNEDAVLDYLKRVISGLPTDSQKQQLTDNLELINKHIHDMQERIRLLPNDSHKNEIMSAIDLIRGFLSSAKENPPVAAALGLPFKRTLSGSTKKVSEPQVGEKLFRELNSLSTDEILQRLLDYRTVSMADLRALAKRIDIRHPEGANRKDLADQILKLGFANIRGYEKLRSPNGTQIRER
jgi:uncharacterized protein YeeX (DUF496 family)